MSQVQSSSLAPPDRATHGVKRDLALIVGIVLALGVPSLFTRDLWTPDEPRYTEVAREMVVMHEYLVPHLNGRVYSEKPPLFFWLAAALWQLGCGYNSGRLVTVFAVLGTSVILYFAVRRTGLRPVALPVVCLTLSSLLMLHFGKRGVIDPLLTLTVTVAILSGYLALQPDTGRRKFLWLACYLCMGVGVLCKGPVGLAVPALVLLAYGILHRRHVRGGGWIHVPGVLLLAAVVLAWLGPAVLSAGHKYAQTMVVKQSARRIVSSYSHREPFYFYVVKLPGYLFPWTALLPLAITAAIRTWRRSREGMPLFALIWLLLPVLFFSAISGKRVNYALPIAPAVGLLCGWYLLSEARREGKFLRAEMWLLHIAAGIPVCLGLALVLVLPAVKLWPGIATLGVESRAGHADEVLAWLTWGRVALGVVLLLIPLVLLILSLRAPLERPGRRLGLLIAGSLAGSLFCDLVVTPALNTVKSPKALSVAVLEHVAKSERVYMYASDFSGSYNLYTGILHLPIMGRHDEEMLKDLLKRPDVVVIASSRHLDGHLTPEEIEKHTVYSEGVGHRRMFLLRGVAGEPPLPATTEGD